MYDHGRQPATRQKGLATLRYDDLDCSVFTTEIPAWVPGRVDELYESLYAVPDYARLFDHAEPTGAVVVGDRDQVAAFSVSGREAFVSTRVASFPPAAVETFCRALFRALPQVRCVRIEVLFDPADLTAPHRTLVVGEDYVIPLPATPEEYRAQIGKTTRKHLRQYANRLRREAQELRFDTISGADLSRRDYNAVIDFNIDRMRSKGTVSGFEHTPREREALYELLSLRGEATLLRSDDGPPVAAVFGFRVGHHFWTHTIGHDPARDRLHPGLLTMLAAIDAAIEHGDREFHMGWTTPVYKQRLGAVRREATTLLVYRDRRACLRDARRWGDAWFGRFRTGVWWWRLTHAPSIVGRRMRDLGDRAGGRLRRRG